MFTFGSSLTTSPIDRLSPPEGYIKPIQKPHAKFSREDDDELRRLVELYGENNWTVIAENMPGRNQRQCKERWMNYLSPSLNTGAWTQEEDTLLLEKQRELGSKWVSISKFFNNRTDAMVKNRFQLLKRKAQKHREMFLKAHVQIPMAWLTHTPTPAATHASTFKQAQLREDIRLGPVEVVSEHTLFDHLDEPIAETWNIENEFDFDVFC